MHPPRIRVGHWIALLALGAILFLLVFHLGRSPFRASTNAPQPPSTSPETLRSADRGPEERSHLTDNLNSAATDVHSDLRLVNEIFMAYRGALLSGNPVGENAEITAVLTGRNKLGFAFIPKDCAAINRKGELCDRWGTPYFFHQLSGEKMEIRSAGPDLRLWTADDEVLTP
jgi:hypothetical protein